MNLGDRTKLKMGGITRVCKISSVESRVEDTGHYGIVIHCPVIRRSDIFGAFVFTLCVEIQTIERKERIRHEIPE